MIYQYFIFFIQVLGPPFQSSGDPELITTYSIGISIFSMETAPSLVHELS